MTRKYSVVYNLVNKVAFIFTADNICTSKIARLMTCIDYIFSARYEVFIAVNIFWDVKPCSLAERYQTQDIMYQKTIIFQYFQLQIILDTILNDSTLKYLE
jgi:hypothetical protein